MRLVSRTLRGELIVKIKWNKVAVVLIGYIFYYLVLLSIFYSDKFTMEHNMIVTFVLSPMLVAAFFVGYKLSGFLFELWHK